LIVGALVTGPVVSRQLRQTTSKMIPDSVNDILLQIANGRVPEEDVDSLPGVTDELRQALKHLRELDRFVMSFCQGDLSVQLNAKGRMAGALKTLHANLRHLTWQTKQVAAGDFDQRVEFLGEFSTAFNYMVTALAKAREDLTVKNLELASAYEELKSTQAQLLQQDKMAAIGQLAAGVAHEINNPIGFIMSNLETLRRYQGKIAEFMKVQNSVINECYKSSQYKDHLTQVEEKKRLLKIDYIMDDTENLIGECLEGTERVKRIVQDLKTFSRVDEVGYKAADINSGLESTINIVWNELKYKITLIREYGDIPLTLCNPGQLNQVFMNILLNASHAIEHNGEVRIRTWREGRWINVAISDTGIGMPDDIKKRIFEPFFTTKEVGKGTGLGLSIAYDIICKHNGEIEVESTLGKGSTFIISIPLVEK